MVRFRSLGSLRVPRFFSPASSHRASTPRPAGHGDSTPLILHVEMRTECGEERRVSVECEKVAVTEFPLFLYFYQRKCKIRVVFGLIPNSDFANQLEMCSFFQSL